MNTLLEPFYDQYKFFFDGLSESDGIRIGTLGPSGTSSEQALKYFIAGVRNYNCKLEFEKILINKFTDVYKALEDGLIDYALIPTAYERITDFFWNYHFMNNLNFIFPTPEYGMVCKNNYKPDNHKKIKIACCPAVENIIEYLTDGELTEGQIERVKTNSTTESVLCLLNNGADLAVTNRTSFDLYADREIKFMTKTYHANMVWALFKRK